MTFTKATLRPAATPGAFILDNDGDEQLLFSEDLDHLRHLIESVLEAAPHVHNAEPNDPDSHVLFASVCCGAVLYRCAVTNGWNQPLPCKPIIHQGENECRECGAVLLPF